MEVSKRKGGVLQKMVSSVLFSVSSVCPTAIVYLPVYFSINCDTVSKSRKIVMLRRKMDMK